MTVRRLATPLALAAAALLPHAASAQTIVTAPAGASQTVDPFPGYMTWYRDDVRPGATAGITATYPRSGTGSMLLTNNGSAAKANVALYVDPALYPFTSLGSFLGYGYEYYRNGASTAADHLAPAIRLLIDADGSNATTNDRGSLIYEPIYNGVTTVATNQWVSVGVGATTNLWWFQSGVGVEEVYNRTLADYQAGTYTPTAGFAQLSGNSLVYGINFGTGSGWAGNFEGAVDNVYATVGSPIGPVTQSWNFEAPVTATPEPASLALLGTGLLALGGVAVRRKRGA